MTAEQSEMQQRLANLVRIGRVHSVDLEAKKLRLSFGGGNISAPVPFPGGAAGAAKEWNPPSVGEQMVMLSLGGTDNSGVILYGSYYQTEFGANGTDAGNRELDLPEGGKWRVTVGDSTVTFENGTVKIDVGGITLEVADKVTITGDVEITGNVAITGEVTSTGDMTAGAISLQTHVHGGVESGSSSTTGPIP